MGDYKVNKGDNLYNIAKEKYALTNKQDIMEQVHKIAKANKIKNINLIKVDQTLKLPEELNLESVSIMTPNSETATTLKDETGNTNYYRANTIFGDIATLLLPKKEVALGFKTCKSTL